MADFIEIKVSESDKYNPENWMYFPDSFSYSGHMHYGSPYECADDCGTCDGAKCEYCHKVYDEPSYAIGYEFVEKVVKENGLDQDVSDAAVNKLADDYGSWPCFEVGDQEYMFEIPKFYELEMAYKKGENKEAFESLCKAIGYELD